MCHTAPNFAVKPVAAVFEHAVIGGVVALDPADDLLGVEPAVVDRHAWPRIAPDQPDPCRRPR